MKKKNIFTLVIASLLVISVAVVFTACDNEPEKPEVPETSEVSTTENKIPEIEQDTTEETTEETTEKETVKETEKVTEKATEKVTQKPASNKTETPKKDTPKKDNTETTKKPSSSNSNKNDSGKNDSGATGGLDLSTFDVTRTSHVGGESSEELHESADKVIKENGWNMDWELN